MNTRAADLLSKLMYKEPAASEVTIQRLISALGHPLPDDYVEFLRASDGAEGFITGNEYLLLYPSCELIKGNVEDDYWRNEFAPGLTLFGSDGGGTAYAFDTRLPDFPIVDTPFIGGGLDCMKTRGRTFSEFI